MCGGGQPRAACRGLTMSDRKEDEVPPVSDTAHRVLTPTGSRRVPPNPEAPKLRPSTEKRIAVADEKSAQAYDELDASRAKIALLKEMLDDGKVQVVLDIGDTAVHVLKEKI